MNQKKIIACLIIFLGLTLFYFFKDASPILRLFWASLGMIWVIKIAGFIWQKSERAKESSVLGEFLFMTAWPGISLNGFTKREATPPQSTGLLFAESWVTFLGGIALLVFISYIGQGKSTFLNYIALLSVFLIVHLGLIEILADMLRLAGLNPTSLFKRPYLSTSMQDFWSTRWNKAFVDMNKIFILKPFHNKISARYLRFSIFAVSGLLHELGISYADGKSWGKPFLYFIIQSVGMEIEKHKKLPKILLWCWIMFPLPLLFPPAFTNLFLGKLSNVIFVCISSLKVEDIIYYALILGGFCHLLVLCASVQVPVKLEWDKEFKKLTSLNRKIFWTYGGYIFSIIIFMSVVSFVLAGQSFLTFQLSSLFWIFFIAIFWWARVLIDFFYMNHDDWPKGALFTIGHTCLTTLFVFMSILYTTIFLLILREYK